MYFTNTPSLNSIEAMMKRPPGSRQRGGGRNRSPYRYRKKDCDCRLCLYYRKRNGCVMKVCPVLDIRLSCKAASFREAVKAAFADVKHIPFQRRLSQIYDRKDDVPMLFQNDRHRQIFETQQISLRKPDMGNRYSPTTIVAAITSRETKSDLPTHVKIDADGLKTASTVLLEQIRTIDKSRLGQYVGRTDKDTMGKIDYALIASFGLKYMAVLLG